MQVRYNISMDTARLRQLSKGACRGKSVVYLMSRDQRAQDNHALVAAQAHALQHRLPLVVVFNLLARSGYRKREHFEFMLAGLKEVQQALQAHNITFCITFGEAETSLIRVLDRLQPAALFLDFSPLEGPRSLAKRLAKKYSPCFVVDTHNIVPLWEASDKQEFAAHTLRLKIHRQLEQWLGEPERLQKHPFVREAGDVGISLQQARAAIADLPRAGITVDTVSGEKHARQHLKKFIETGLKTYAQRRNDIADDGQSGLSPYLHFGQISSLRVVLEVLAVVKTEPLIFRAARMAQAGSQPSAVDGMNALFEEIIVRKELADNYCYFAKSYTSLEGAPAWSQVTLAKHAKDPREHLYSCDRLEKAQTHDSAWNAAQQQLRRTGKMHGYMRMYWAKKILEWTSEAQEAINIAIYLNDSYSIDGGDPNGYAGIMWSIAGVHDRPWPERPIFGTVRYMNLEGLKRRFDLAAYIRQY